MGILSIFISFFISLVSTIFLVPLCSKIAIKFGILDIPDGRVKKHLMPIPYLGGVAIYSGFMIALLSLYPLERKIFVFVVSITLFLLLGLIDDIISMKPYQKFLGQMFVGLYFLNALQNSFVSTIDWYFPLYLFWILLLVNAFNLVDVMDGLATTIAACATFSFLIISLRVDCYGAGIVLSALLGSLVAFFYYNKPPASIYMGDAGSLYIGGFLAIIPFIFPFGHHGLHNFFISIIILAIPILEVASLIIIRSYKKIPFYKASPDHFSMYLRRAGLSRVQILAQVIIVALILLIMIFLLIFSELKIFSLLLLLLMLLAECFLILKKKYILS